ncbi:MAG: Thymidine kinase [Candidatus Woesebacteria bacterium GW2011_GWB1_45_5]|uniref:Thymidine kinase n=1 Tax=Candidatus Woesebacteria bacterium GW2011_GWB1_45_5 TaxID=1618581 RepID=A0A0G1MPX5_9BACT|nr:MAG: Thymidine kinase [Candidatus Woesebacteria bacterium GW2011_GWB1_45_5]
MLERFAERKKVHSQLEIIAGSMFSGKTDELIRRLVREEIAKLNVQVFKPSIDTRGNMYKITSHSKAEHNATPVEDSRSIIALVRPDTQVVGIDEAQFFDSEIVNVCEELVSMGKRVIVAGLPADFRGEPFGSMPQLMAKAEEVDKVHAVCMTCGEEADFTQRIKIIDGERMPVDYNDPLILVGAGLDYEARCRRHHEVPGKPASKLHDG